MLMLIAQADAPNPLLSMLPLILIMIVIWYLLVIGPQRKQQKQRDEMLKNLKANDHVITSGGICGVITKVREHDVILKIDEESNTKVRVLKSAIIAVEKETTK